MLGEVPCVSARVGSGEPVFALGESWVSTDWLQRLVVFKLCT